MMNVKSPMAMVLGAIAIVSLAAGMPFSPYFDPVLYWLGRMSGRTMIGSPVLFHGTTIIIAVATFFISAWPAYLLARRIGKGTPHPAIMVLGLAVAIAIAWPSIASKLGMSD